MSDGGGTQMGGFVWLSACIAFGWGGSGCWPIGRLLPTSSNEAIALGEAQHELPRYIPPSPCKRDLTLCRNLTSALPLTSHYTPYPSPKYHKGKTNINIKIKKMQGAGCCIRGNKKKAIFPHKQPYRQKQII